MGILVYFALEKSLFFFFFYAGLLANQDPHFIVVAIVLWVNWQPLFFIHSIPNRRIGETFWVSKATKVFYSTCGHHSTFNYDLHHIHVLRLMKFFLCFMLLCKDLTRLVSTDILLNCFKLIRAEKEGAEMLELICIHFFTEQLYAIVEFVETVLKISVSIRKKKGVCFTNNPNLFQFFSFYSLVWSDTISLREIGSIVLQNVFSEREVAEKCANLQPIYQFSSAQTAYSVLSVHELLKSKILNKHHVQLRNFIVTQIKNSIEPIHSIMKKLIEQFVNW